VFHVLNRGARRGGLFDNHGDYQAFEAILVKALRRFRIALFAYCLMQNHWHLVLSPSTDHGLSRFMHWLTFIHARRWRLARATDGQGAVYQGRFKAIPIGGDAHFIWVCRYVERNALRALLVQRAEDWPWSSLWQRQHNANACWLSPWPVAIPSNWTALVNEPQTETELNAFRRALARNEPFGAREWAAVITEQMGPVRKRGRPPKSGRA
jgi:putative transposase